MKYYLDTEFAEIRGSMKLISIGIISSEGNTFYAENSCFDIDDANDWVKDNVIPKLKWHENIESTKGHNNISNDTFDNTGEDVLFPEFGIRRKWEVYGSPQVIRDSLKAFFELPQEKDEVDFERQFYAYYSAYDWVVFCWIFGTMMDLPQGMPMFCHDLKPMMDVACEKYNMLKPDDPKDEHNALYDAIWNKELHEKIENSNN